MGAMANSNNVGQSLAEHIKLLVKQNFAHELDSVHIEHPESLDHGDLAANTPLVLAPLIKQSPMEIAKKLVYELQKSPLQLEINGHKRQVFKSVDVASPGFINFKLSPEWLNNVLFGITLRGRNYGAVNIWEEKKVMVEFTDPNPFKVFHVGHVMTNTIGESLSRIFGFLGAEVKRANYQGDVGMHVANSIWGLVKKMAKDNLTLVDLERMELKKAVEYLGQAYSLGATAYEADEASKNEIKILNNYVYLAAQNILAEEGAPKGVDYQAVAGEQKSPFSLELITSLYKAGRKWSLDYFELLYKRLGTKFDHYYFESQTGEMGAKLVQEHLKDGVFKKDQGAVIFEGEKHGLHTRVFVNSKGLPVYEAKDLGLAVLKNNDYPYDLSYIITGNEVNDYFNVVLKAMELIRPDLAAKTTHIGHGMMVLKHGKMSSRTGTVISGEDLLEVVKGKVMEKMSQSSLPSEEAKNQNEIADKVAVASVKYSILKSSLGHDIVYDEEEATNLLGNTGPYLQYTYTRTRSVLEKAGISREKEHGLFEYKLDFDYCGEEMDVLRHIYKFPEQVSQAGLRLSPNLVAGFVYDLAQKYNALYAKVPIIQAPTEKQRRFRLHLTQAVGQVIENGLYLLGIQVVDKM